MSLNCPPQSLFCWFSSCVVWRHDCVTTGMLSQCCVCSVLLQRVSWQGSARGRNDDQIQRVHYQRRNTSNTRTLVRRHGTRPWSCSESLWQVWTWPIPLIYSCKSATNTRDTSVSYNLMVTWSRGLMTFWLEIKQRAVLARCGGPQTFFMGFFAIVDRMSMSMSIWGL